MVHKGSSIWLAHRSTFVSQLRVGEANILSSERLFGDTRRTGTAVLAISCLLSGRQPRVGCQSRKIIFYNLFLALETTSRSQGLSALQYMSHWWGRRLTHTLCDIDPPTHPSAPFPVFILLKYQNR
eukprot:Protomagalhaensia_wolfi_Nauph_80__3791@NODE_383_length_2636_cov_7_043897_g289_i0_p4_GENE_NODE_383_length_2636_cov_7_043897_g289_i0NODE_383_length_2636_cov_7_043897_g289_i0_p4_ORF_typecomplete_len126_score1_87DUF1156/PF06634_12/1_8e03DUF1156/PF06634_12/0_93_NODE_383_length_2636_cov_7_043897_g289_i022292606